MITDEKELEKAFDVFSETGEMSPHLRRHVAERLKQASQERGGLDWVDDQVEELERPLRPALTTTHSAKEE